MRRVNADRAAARLVRTEYIVPDVLVRGLRLVFCGTAPSAASAAAKAYYAKPGNGFWSALYRLGFTDRLLRPSEYRQLLWYGIGLTDLCKTVSGNDDELPPEALDVESLRGKIEVYQPRLIAFTSKHGAQTFFGGKVEYGLQEGRVGKTQFFVCCSTSGRARRFWREEVWQELSEVVRARPPTRVGGSKR